MPHYDFPLLLVLPKSVYSLIIQLHYNTLNGHYQASLDPEFRTNINKNIAISLKSLNEDSWLKRKWTVTTHLRVFYM